MGDDLGAWVFALSQEELGLVFGRLCPAHGPASMDLESKEEEVEEGAVVKVEDAMEVTEEVTECDTDEETARRSPRRNVPNHSKDGSRCAWSELGINWCAGTKSGASLS